MSVCVITGGTGTLGTELIRQINAASYFDEVVVFSRDESKHIELEKKHKNVTCFLGDVTRSEDVGACLRQYRPDSVFHCAALKHVDRGEQVVQQYINTNLNGTINVVNAALNFRIKNFVFFSTDKAVLPINAYGMTKALAEKYIRAKWVDGQDKHVNMSIYRWGNILGSNGSVLKYFVDAIKAKQPVNITHSDMTRFWLTINEAVYFVLTTYLEIQKEARICPTIKSATLIDIANAVGVILDEFDVKIRFTGIRPGEKIHEHLKSDHDYCIRSDSSVRYKEDELISKLRPTVMELAYG